MITAATRWLEGRGLHGGAHVRARIVAGRANVAGVGFRRVDLAAAPTISATPFSVELSHGAHATNVVDHDGVVFVRTIEHVMSALAGAGLRSGVLVEIDGDELPTLDGASRTWFDAIEAADLVERAPERLDVADAFVFEDGGRCLSIVPSDAFSVEVTIDFAPPIGSQHASWDGEARSYRDEIATARTFAMLDDARGMLAQGLARGIDPGSAVVYASTGPLVAPRGSNEPARHKLLDLVGDLALLGALPRAHVRAARPGHAFIARALRAFAGRARGSDGQRSQNAG